MCEIKVIEDVKVQVQDKPFPRGSPRGHVHIVSQSMYMSGELVPTT